MMLAPGLNILIGNELCKSSTVERQALKTVHVVNII